MKDVECHFETQPGAACYEKCKTMPYSNALRQTQSIIITLSCSVEVSRIEIISVQAAAEAPEEHDWTLLHDSSLCVPSDDPFEPM